MARRRKKDDEIIISKSVCNKYKLTFEEFLYALAIKSADNSVELRNNLLNREVIVVRDGKTRVTPQWAGVLDDILSQSVGDISEERLSALAKGIQDIFPLGFTQKMGHGPKYYYKSNQRAIQTSLENFIRCYGDFTDDEILDAARRYVASFRGNYAYMQMANYFVYKDNRNKGGEIESTLSTFLENKESEEKAVINDDSWLMNSRN